MANSSKKRKVTYEEKADESGRNVNVTDEVQQSNEESNDSLTEQDDERYTPAKGN